MLMALASLSVSVSPTQEKNVTRALTFMPSWVCAGKAMIRSMIGFNAL